MIGCARFLLAGSHRDRINTRVICLWDICSFFEPNKLFVVEMVLVDDEVWLLCCFLLLSSVYFHHQTCVLSWTLIFMCFFRPKRWGSKSCFVIFVEVLDWSWREWDWSLSRFVVAVFWSGGIGNEAFVQSFTSITLNHKWEHCENYG